jgi:hypothetical protein
MEIEFPNDIINTTLTNIKYGECCIFDYTSTTVYMRVNTKSTKMIIPMINLKTAIIAEFPSETSCIAIKTKLKIVPYTD